MRKILITFLILGCLLNIGLQIYSAFYLKNDTQEQNNSNPAPNSVQAQSSNDTAPKNKILGHIQESADAFMAILFNKPNLMPKQYTNYPVPEVLSGKAPAQDFSPAQAKTSVEQSVASIPPATPPTAVTTNPNPSPAVIAPVVVSAPTSEIASTSTVSSIQNTPSDKLTCLVWGPLVDDTLTKAQLLMETYDKDFTDKVKSYEFNKRNLWYVVTKSPVPDKEKVGKLKFWQVSGLNVEKVIFLSDGRAWLNTFTDEQLANTYITSLTKKKIEALLVPDQKSEIYYYIVNPDPKYSARMRAFGLYFSDTQTIETNCLDNQNLDNLHNKFTNKSDTSASQ